MSDRKQRITRSMRGEEVNFDIAEIKNKILSDPEPEITKQRARFIDSRRRRTRTNRTDELLAEQRNNEAAVRAAIAEQKRAKTLEEKEAAPHVTVEDVIIDSPEATTKQTRKIVKDN